jgi:hypothetical protein
LLGDRFTYCYAIPGASQNAQTGQYEVALFNPWGFDTDNSAATGDPNDGILLVSWNDFRHSFYEYTVSQSTAASPSPGSSSGVVGGVSGGLNGSGPGHPMQLN